MRWSNPKKAGALGLIGLGFFAVGLTLVPDFEYTVAQKAINPFIILGYVFFGLAIGAPLFQKIIKRI